MSQVEGEGFAGVLDFLVGGEPADDGLSLDRECRDDSKIDRLFHNPDGYPIRNL